MTINPSAWPVRDFERRFWKQIDVEGLSYLVPATKLGNGLIRKAQEAREVAAKALLGDALPEAVTEYVRKNWHTQPLRSAWIDAIMIPLDGAPRAADIYDYLPFSIIDEIESFFLQSLSGAPLLSSETAPSSSDENGKATAVA